MPEPVRIKATPRPVKPLTEAQLQVVIERNKIRKTATPEQLAMLAQVFPAPAQRNRTKATKQHTSAYNETTGRAGNTDWEKATYKPSDGQFTSKPKQQGKKK